ncbi:hypothetical protein [Streptomyces sp. G-5]|uniref:hypothetical protein n=1 Tax=Streptomyces sp. G-5 TaxID=2977231 RepID=UPI0021D15787|nr:hypothetical protein [Streptomyces sp. G-5]MCU4750229.1 hypothetical protein [Streptomyces sp. G-5]
MTMSEDPAEITRQAAKRAEALLRELRRRYPDALARSIRDAEAKGQPGAPQWPDWCWLPMGSAFAVIAPQHGQRLLPGDPRVADIARISALTTWRLGKGVYWLDSEAVAPHTEGMWARPGVPAERPLQPVRERLLGGGLPQQCVYIAWPPMDEETKRKLGPLALRGLFLHLEYDWNSGRPELRLLIDRDGTWDGLRGVPVPLDRPTLLAAGRELAHEGLSILGLDADDEQTESLAEKERAGMFALWPTILTLIDPSVVISGFDHPADRPQPAEPRTKGGIIRWRGAQDVTRWRVSTHQPRPTLRAVP